MGEIFVSLSQTVWLQSPFVDERHQNQTELVPFFYLLDSTVFHAFQRFPTRLEAGSEINRDLLIKCVQLTNDNLKKAAESGCKVQDEIHFKPDSVFLKYTFDPNSAQHISRPTTLTHY